MASVMKRAELAPGDAKLTQEYEELQAELAEVQRALNRATEEGIAFLKSEFDIDEAFIERLEQSRLPEFGNEFWSSQIQSVPSTSKLEDILAYSYERLMPHVDRDWLRQQSAFKFRPHYKEVLDCRLHLVGRQRLLPRNAPPRPHRFAEMLLVSDDLLKARHDIDLFDGPMLVSEAAALGVALAAIPKLGAEADKKFKTLALIPDRDVASTVYELLVGAACVRSGRDIEMLPASSSQKMPDFRVHDLLAPLVVECKRRLGVGEYAEKEAREVERLQDAVAALLDRHHPHVEVEFKVEVSSIPDTAFAEVIGALCFSSDDEVEEKREWGTVRLRRAPSFQKCSTTRVFSPAFLLEIFGWNSVESEWDGMLCQIEPTSSPVISTVRWPRSLKWKCNTDVSRLKKSRGLTSLWADAAKQIPTGEMGCIYIAYTEGMRPEIGDARTQNLIDTVKNRDLFHRASIRVPLTVISRLYPQAFGDGGLEMIESTIPMTMNDFDHMLADFPTRVFHVDTIGK